MDVCLMIEGQEGMTWEPWVTLAHACETFGLAACSSSASRWPSYSWG